MTVSLYVLKSTRKLCTLLLIGGMLGASLLPGLTSAADTVEGTLNGLLCAQRGFICPIEDLDVVVSLESDFVVMQTDGKYTLIPNVDRAVKARHMLENVKVIGRKHPRYNSIVASEFQVEQADGSYKTTWSTQMRRRVYNDLKLPGSSRP